MMGQVFEVKVIKPKKMNIPAVRQAVLEALEAEAQDILADYRQTTATWEHQVEFETIIDITSQEASVLVGTDDPIFRYVDEGTRPHMIFPRRARKLRFQTGYSAKTKPGKIGSWPGGKYGPVVFADRVSHPGTKAREFTKAIQKRRKSKFTRRMVEAMKAGAERLY